MQYRNLVRNGFLAIALLALLAGLAGGWERSGWYLPSGSALGLLHGPLLISGLFGTLLGVKRAFAVGQRWAYIAPAVTGIGTLALLAGAPPYVGAGFYVLSAAVLCSATLFLTLANPTISTGTLLIGAVMWLTGNLLWLIDYPLADVEGWWVAFLVLTVAGERLRKIAETSPQRGSDSLIFFAAGLLGAGAQNGLMTDNGAALFGVALIVLNVWFLKYDGARRSMKVAGRPRFAAACILLGSAWLGIAGGAFVALPPGLTPAGHNLALHAVLIGFVLSIGLGHLLIAMPAIDYRRRTYQPMLYLPLVALHGSVAIRAVGDVLESGALRQWSDVLTIVTLVGTVISLAAGTNVLRDRRVREAVAAGT